MYHVRNKMDSVGLDMLLDIHGDEELPYNFINGNEVIPPLLALCNRAFLPFMHRKWGLHGQYGCTLSWQILIAFTNNMIPVTYCNMIVNVMSCDQPCWLAKACKDSSSSDCAIMEHQSYWFAAQHPYVCVNEAS